MLHPCGSVAVPATGSRVAWSHLPAPPPFPGPELRKQA